MGQINHPSDLFDTIRDLQRQIDEVRKRVGLSSATISDGTLTVQGTGAIRFVDPSGFERLLIGTRADIPLADGSPQPVFFLRDAAGKLRIALYDPDPITDGYQPVAWIYDHLNHVAFTTDINGGVAEPWIPVPMYAQFIDTVGSEATTYRQLPVSGVPGTQVVWEGRIGRVSHPRIQVEGVWGMAIGPGTANYALVVGGTTVGTWSNAGLVNTASAAFDISTKLTNTHVPVQVTVNVTGAAPADRVALGLLGCWMRQTPGPA